MQQGNCFNHFFTSSTALKLTRVFHTNKKSRVDNAWKCPTDDVIMLAINDAAICVEVGYCERWKSVNQYSAKCVQILFGNK